jgi:hypothetical protein
LANTDFGPVTRAEVEQTVRKLLNRERKEEEFRGLNFRRLVVEEVTAKVRNMNGCTSSEGKLGSFAFGMTQKDDNDTRRRMQDDRQRKIIIERSWNLLSTRTVYTYLCVIHMKSIRRNSVDMEILI